MPAPGRNGYCLTQDCSIQYPPRMKSRAKANGSTKLETQLGDDRETAHRRLPPQLRSPHVEHRREKSHQRQKTGMLDIPPPLQHGTLNKVAWKGRLRWQPGQARPPPAATAMAPRCSPLLPQAGVWCFPRENHCNGSASVQDTSLNSP